MIYLSANGEVLGQFEEDELPRLLSEGRITDSAFYWREGMAEWRPVKELPKREAAAPPASTPKPAVVLPAMLPAGKKPFIPRRGPVAQAASASAVAAAGAARGTANAPAAAAAARWTPPAKAVAPGKKVSPAKFSLPAQRAPIPRRDEEADDFIEAEPRAFANRPASAISPLAPRGKRRGWLVWLAVLLAAGALAGGGAWWWIANAEPPVIPGEVALAGDEAGPVEVRVFRREALAAPWRERLAAADARAAEVEGLLTAAQATQREKSLLRDEAARVCEVGEEYNMPDVADLRADRDAKQAEAEAAQAEVEKLEAEKSSLLTFESLLEAVPAPLRTMVADAAGAFSMPSPEDEEVVLLATASTQSGGKREKRAWLEIVERPAEGEAPGKIRFSEANRLSVDEIRRFASAGKP